jgi:HSP20 family protein
VASAQSLQTREERETMKKTLLVKKKHPGPATKREFVPPPWPPPDGFPRTPGVRYGYIWWPPVEIEETNEEYVFAADLAGIERSDVDIELIGDEIMVSGTDGAAPFAFAITLPEPVDADDVEAELENGVLEVTVTKSASKRRDKIELKD